MMVVISDATPLNVLVRMGQVEILPRLFRAVIIPPAVATELSHPHTPSDVRDWLAMRPPWLSVQSPTQILQDVLLGAGEREAISLAKELKADLQLVDDKKARQAAVRHGVSVAGTLGVLEAAAAQGLIDLAEAFRRLPADFSIAPRLLKESLERNAQRRRQDQNEIEDDGPGEKP